MKNIIEKIFNPVRKHKVMAVVFVIVFIVGCRLGELYRLSRGDITVMLANIDYLYRTLPRFRGSDIQWGIICVAILSAWLYWQKLTNKNMKPGEEYGAARWGTADDIKPYIDPDFYNNVILSQTEFLTMKPKMKVFEHNRNKNVLIYGGSGSGKTYGVVKPNLLQLNASYVLTDPKGTLLPQTGNLFKKAGYRIKVLDTKNFASSMHYNPFAYIRKEEDVMTLAKVLYENLKGENDAPTSDPMWDNGAILCLSAFIAYLWLEAPENEQNVGTMMEMFSACEIRDDDPDFKNAVDLLFDELEENSPDSFALRQWKAFRVAAGKTAKSILITIGANMSPFNMQAVRDLMSYDEMQLDTYGDKNQKTILYAIISDTNKTFNFISAIMFTQAFNIWCDKADMEYDGELPTPIRCILDEFANIGKIPDFEILIATIRSRLISTMIFCQTKSQLKRIYKDDVETIEGNCDTSIFLGGREKTTLKDMEECLGDETIDLFNNSENYGQSRSSGQNFQKLGRKLKSVFELNVMPRNKCIVQLSGVPPFFSDKYNTSNHPRYKYLSDYDKKNTFDFEVYKKQRAIEKNIVFRRHDVYKAIKVN